MLLKLKRSAIFPDGASDHIPPSFSKKGRIFLLSDSEWENKFVLGELLLLKLPWMLNFCFLLGLMTYSYNPGSWEAVAGGLP